jgi:AcrR family transcriptional regulator
MNVKKKPDRRPQRTKRQLSKALIELVQEKRFDEITVQNVIDRADIGRSTFYTHFRDKEDLLDKDWERFLYGFA